MDKPWGEYGWREWLSTQVRKGFSTRPRVPSSIPEVDLPGCATGGHVSYLRWLNWQQANSAVAFGVQLTREITTALAGVGITPVESWLSQSQHAIAWGGRKELFASSGVNNAVYLVTRVAIPRRSLTQDQLQEQILPPICQHYPADENNQVSVDKLPGPYGHRVWAGPDRWDPNKKSDFLEVRSPVYYQRYLQAPGFPGRRISNWPLNPAEEREPLIYPDKPRRTKLPREEVLPFAEYTLAEVARWSQYLGCQIGATTSGWHLDWNEATVKGYETYVITAPVTLTTTEAEIGERALPHTAVSAPVGGASREPRVMGYRHRSPLVTFSIFNGLWARINDADTPGQLVLTIASDGYKVR